jgi:XTP/dITP diphosphohydrolase
MAALADDSGLCVHSLGGAPGVYSARYAAMAGGEKSDAANNRRLVAALAGQADLSAVYVAVLVYVRSADDPLPIIAQGLWRGEITPEPRGANGFGYDPHFLVPDLNLTAAELDAKTKHALSHRGQALRRLLDALQEENSGNTCRR